MPATSRKSGKKSRLDILWICDCSKSMKSKGKSGSQNTVIREIIEELKEIPSEAPEFDINVRAISFSDEAKWVDADYIPVTDYQWNDLSPTGCSNLGAAFNKIKEQIIQEGKSTKHPIILILISDGYPTDDWAPALEDMKDVLKNRNPVYCAIRIQDTADDAILAFAGDGEDRDLRIMDTDSIENIIQIVRSMVLAS